MKIDSIEVARAKTAEHLSIDLREPKQQRRIAALQDLYNKYAEESDVKSLIYKDISDCCLRLIDIHSSQQKLLDELKIENEPPMTKKIKLRNIKYKYKGEIEKLGKRISIDHRLLKVCEDRYSEDIELDVEHKKRLKEFEDRCWDNWLRSIDVNKELCNTVIGFENRKYLLEISKLYIDYHILANSDVSKCFDELREKKKEGIKRYYDILSKYQLPIEKKVDFKIFLQKMIESQLSDSMEVKTIFGEFSDAQRTQIDDLIEEIRNQYKRDQADMISVINYHKKYLINKQVLFTNESENLVLYFKSRYIEKIDLLCSRFQMYHFESTLESKSIVEKKMKLFKQMLQDEFDQKLNELKMNFSKQAIPFLDNFWYLEQDIEQSLALDEMSLTSELMKMKESKNLGLQSLIEDFETQRKKIKIEFDKKMSVMSGISDVGFNKFDTYLRNLKEECELLCCEVINGNARLWTRIHAEFNCMFRTYFVRLRHHYSPYIQSWRAGSKPWMNEYLYINLNQELLRAKSEVLKGISPESDYYKKIADRLLNLNEKIRNIMVKRDSMEFDQLMKLNSLPKTNCELFKKLAEQNLHLRQDCYLKFEEDYNSYERHFFI